MPRPVLGQGSSDLRDERRLDDQWKIKVKETGQSAMLARLKAFDCKETNLQICDSQGEANSNIRTRSDTRAETDMSNNVEVTVMRGI